MSAVLPESEMQPAAAAGPPELFIVMNRGSGSTEKDESRRAIEAELMGAARPHRFVPVAPGELPQACRDAARLAKAHGGVLVAVGGDGTINAAAQAALTEDCPLGVIAQGTFNLFARQLGLPLDAGQAAQAILQAQPEPVQVGLVNERVFLVNASVGLYPKLLADRETVKQKLGRRRWIAMLAALKSMLEWRLQLRLDGEVDGELTKLRTSSIFVCNNQLQVERVGIEEKVVAQLANGRMVCLLVRASDWWAKLRLLGAALLGRLGQVHEIDAFSLRTLSVTTRNARQVKVATDGEVQWMQLPLRFTVAPRPLKVMLPPPEQRLPRE
ncbi:MAG TPA: diacylglycerol kinase family protein [Ramlibacter sp.]|jgi:diacylglycerol kinase family enzyme|nr:diacylglycerol kinase family protein [Ramlibacter sp.]